MKAKSSFFVALFTFALLGIFMFTSNQAFAKLNNFTPCCRSNKLQLSALRISLIRTQQQAKKQRERLRSLSLAHSKLLASFTSFATTYVKTLNGLRREVRDAKGTAVNALIKRLHFQHIKKSFHNPKVGQAYRTYCPTDYWATGGGYDANSGVKVEHSLPGPNYFQCRLLGSSARLDCYVVCCKLK